MKTDHFLFFVYNFIFGGILHILKHFYNIFGIKL